MRAVTQRALIVWSRYWKTPPFSGGCFAWTEVKFFSSVSLPEGPRGPFSKAKMSKS
ncbi:hypothetical protein BKP42_59080 [Rhodococcus erythropolis]|nr:hypothetical protein BKP42_59080 [Rhodococcus erythropolis]